MNTNQTYTPQQAAKYFLANVSNIDLGELVKNMAVHEPAAFGEYLQSITGMTPRQLAMRMAKEQPDTFMRRANFENRHVEAATFIISELKLRNGGKVPAIKKAREVWGLTLKEAKDIIDTVQHELEKMRIIAPSNCEDRSEYFDDAMQNIFLKIVEAA